jgi:hypothetical protein
VHLAVHGVVTDLDALLGMTLPPSTGDAVLMTLPPSTGDAEAGATDSCAAVRVMPAHTSMAIAIAIIIPVRFINHPPCP